MFALRMSRERCRLSFVVAFAFGLCGAFTSQAAAETHAVVVGIDGYLTLPHLLGAVADANDITTALRKAGVTDLVTLVDGGAGDRAPTRKNVLGAIDRLVAHARKDDLAIITFAGHGAKESWGKVHPPGTQIGGEHEIFLLQNLVLPNVDGEIDPKLPGSAAERILGAEMAVRLKQLDDKGVRTIFVADTCHGGGLTRDPQIDAGLTFRFVPAKFKFADGVDPLQTVIGSLPAPINTDTDTQLVSFLAAVDRDSKAPEVEIPKGSGHKRGALSYAFARVIEGQALQNGKVDLSHGDLIDYVLASIKNSAMDNGTGQRPDLRPRQNFDRIAIRFGTDLKPDAALAPVRVTSELPVIRIYSNDGKPVNTVKRPELGYAMEPAPTSAAADLVYDPEKRSVFSKDGDLLATDITPVDLEGVVEREIAIRQLVRLSQTRVRSLALDRGDRRYIECQFMSLDARKRKAGGDSEEYYMLVIISGNGLVQFEYPRGGDPRILPIFSPLGSMQASTPFGADLAVLVVDEKPFDGLIKAVSHFHETVAPNAVVALIEKSLTPTMKIGLQGIYTAPKPLKGPCPEQ
jgi:Caspase domain